jgi:aquaporin Z
MDIALNTASVGFQRGKESFLKNWKHYFQEALGLAIFMISACLFSGLFFGYHGLLVHFFSTELRQILLGILMGLTALFIIYSPVTSPSGAHINPAVTLAFLRTGKIEKWDVFFYMIFQFTGGTIAVYFMGFLMGDNLSASPLNYVVTRPGKFGDAIAAVTEFLIAIIIMGMVLFTSNSYRLKKFTRQIAAFLVCVYVIIAGPISGFGMNPARSFSSALPANIWTSFWIYMLMPLAGMLSAAEIYLLNKKKIINARFRFRHCYKFLSPFPLTHRIFLKSGIRVFLQWQQV